MRAFHIVIGATMLLALSPDPAHAVPAFARKYGTSCTTCHTVYPKLTPFGEAFRRNGFRFPGIDRDYIKQDSITLRRSASGDTATLPAQVPLALGFKGETVFHPDKNSSAGKADHGAAVSSADTIAEGQLWAGGSFSEKATFFAELVVSSHGAVELENAQVHLNDLIGPAHAFNLRVGRGASHLTSFGPHSTYLADAFVPATPVTALNGATSDSWNIGGHFNGVELSGVVAAGRVAYSVGWNAGSNRDARTSQDVYGHFGVKVGGMRLDGEGNGKTTNADRPWEETAITFDAFAYHSRSNVSFPALTDGGPEVLLDNSANVVGGSIRAQWGSLELNSGAYVENHLHAQGDGSSAKALVHFDELSFVVAPWIVPAVRFELTQLRPDAACGGGGGACPRVTDARIMPGVALLPYPNLKFTVAALLESADGAPPGGWGAVGGHFEPGATSNLEFQNVTISGAFAF
jgi:hypothetical protein